MSNSELGTRHAPAFYAPAQRVYGVWKRCFNTDPLGNLVRLRVYEGDSGNRGDGDCPGRDIDTATQSGGVVRCSRVVVDGCGVGVG